VLRYADRGIRGDATSDGGRERERTVRRRRATTGLAAAVAEFWPFALGLGTLIWAVLGFVSQ